MKSVLQTSLFISKKQKKNNAVVLAQRSFNSFPNLVNPNNSAKYTRTVSSEGSKFSNSLTQKRFIGEDSWAAEGLVKNGEVLESVKEKPLILIDDAYLKTPTPEVKRICDAILSMNIVDIHMLVNLVQSRLGITDDDLSIGGSGGGGGGAGSAAIEEAVVAEPVKEKTAFDIKLTIVDPKSKIKIIKEVRALTGLGLKEAKDLVEKAPVVIKEGVKKEDLEAITKILTAAGAEFEVL